MSFLIIPLHLSFGLPVFRCPPTSSSSVFISIWPNISVSLLLFSHLCLPYLPLLLFLHSWSQSSLFPSSISTTCEKYHVLHAMQLPYGCHMDIKNGLYIFIYVCVCHCRLAYYEYHNHIAMTNLLDIVATRVRTIIQKINSRIFQYIPGWVELNFQDISDTVYHTSIAINMLLSIYFTIFGGGGTFSSHFEQS